ncbi:signal recognition particle receptor subunit alpha [Enteropsectra breve]|nr:signal recognition particle receptor subunit alpha [Enteropsectra breve]
MSYFAIFNKRGIVLYEEGTAPMYLNNLIQKINTVQLEEKRKIRDDFLEYKIKDQIVYMLISKGQNLEEKIEQFQPLIDESQMALRTTPENALKENDTNNESNKDTKEDVVSSKSKKGKKMKEKSDILNFSDNKPSTYSKIASSISNFSLKRAFNVFSSSVDLKELKYKMNELLIRKNVSPVFTEVLVDDIISTFKSEGIERVNEQQFKQRLVEVLQKVLISFNHDNFIDNIRKSQKIYSMCFVGVNGVGKSTSLAKVACWLLQKGLKVYIAACDTFRAGAIEQLKVHVERFKQGGHSVGFYESGYSRDDANVAKYAIAAAEREGYDVILIDTAGRMHNKEHLMNSLGKLVRVNNPSHILFVGEALVGGDSLEHIKQFNKYIGDNESKRKIDSIFLTKADTVDDKIGQIINLSLSANAPVMFLGMGQTNSDLVPMSPETVAELLCS